MTDTARILLTDPRFSLGCALAFLGLVLVATVLFWAMDKPWRPRRVRR